MKSSKYISNLKLTPKQVFMLWESLNSIWFSNAKKDQLQLLRVLRRELMSMSDNHQVIEKTDDVLCGEWMDNREDYMDEGLSKKGFYAVKSKKREEMQI